jgi:prefoldin subunit 5
MRKEITEAQITELMRAIPRAEEVDRLRAENERLRAEVERLRENVDRLGKEVERADRLREEIARVKADNRYLVNRALEAKP